MFRLDARHENQLTRGSQGVTTPAACKPASPQPRQVAGHGNRRSTWWARWSRVLALPLVLAFGPGLGGQAQAEGSLGRQHLREPAVVSRGSQGQATQAGANQVRQVARLDAQGVRTLQRIRAGGPFPYAKDGIVFGNYEHLLPAAPRGYYREYTVPTPGSRDRGARRIVCGGAPRSPDVCYYTHDHYASFQYIAR